ncbi:MAG: glycosyltransferase family 2 protein [Bacteroidales bacterium]
MHRKNPKISVITPTYNASSCVERAILSVAQQSYKQVEHVFIDNHSTDGTLDIIRRYQEKYDHIRVYSQKDNGLYNAMNIGIDRATGDWLYFLGADDELYHQHIFTELFDEGYLYSKKVIYGNVLIKGETTWAKDNSVYDGEFDLGKLLHHNICHQAILYPAKVIRKAGYFTEKYFVTADWEYNFRCYALGSFIYVDKIIAIFTGGGVSSKGIDDKMTEDLPGLFIKYFKLNIYNPSNYLEDSPYYPIMKNLPFPEVPPDTGTGFTSKVWRLIKKFIKRSM